jgi:hypothetical protein
MTLLFVGIASLLSVLAGAILFARHRPTGVAALQPRPETYRSIRVLHDHDEIRDAARRAYQRERFIAREADRRGARQLTRLQPGFATVRVVAGGTTRDRALAADDS